MKLRNILAASWAYRLLNFVLNDRRGRSTLVRDYITPQPGIRLLDMGCGPGNMLPYLPDVNYVGFDTSIPYIADAKKRFGNRGTFLVRTLGQDNLRDLGKFDIAISIGVLHHLDDPTARQFFEAARDVLNPGGKLITFDGCYCHGQSRIARFLLSKDRGRYVRTEEDYRCLGQAAFPYVETFIRHDLIRIPYSHIIMRLTAC